MIAGMDFKLHIHFPITDAPTGGGNQFLRALQQFVRSQGALARGAEQADAILFNSHHQLGSLAELKRAFPHVPLIHRVDGPMRLYNNVDDSRDAVVYWAAEHLADGTVFQSEWSRRKNVEMGIPETAFSTVIPNAPNPDIFSRRPTADVPRGRKPRLVATSWSDNPNKGFDTYAYLDGHHVPDDFELTFVGNSPVQFHSVRHLDPLPSGELAQELRRHDIFLTASRCDPCSNSLIEALHTGLPAIARDDGGHPELVGQGGELFERPEQIPALVERIVGVYEDYVEAFDLPSIEEVGRRYVDFCGGVVNAVRERRYAPKTLSEDVLEAPECPIRVRAGKVREEVDAGGPSLIRRVGGFVKRKMGGLVAGD